MTSKFTQRNNNSLARWLYTEEDDEVAEILDVENLNCCNHIVVETSSAVEKKEIVVCTAPPPLTASERRTSVVETPILTTKEISSVLNCEERQLALIPQASEQQLVAVEPKARSKGAIPGRRLSTSTDPRILWEKRLAEAQQKEKAAHMQITELQRKIQGLEDRLRAVKHAKQKMEKKTPGIVPKPTPEVTKVPDTLGIKVCEAVTKLIQDRDLDDSLKQTIVEAVAATVAQTLLSSSAAPVVVPPRRIPPGAPHQQLAQT